MLWGENEVHFLRKREVTGEGGAVVVRDLRGMATDSGSSDDIGA